MKIIGTARDGVRRHHFLPQLRLSRLLALYLNFSVCLVRVAPISARRGAPNGAHTDRDAMRMNRRGT